MKWKKNMEPVSFDSLDWLYLEDYEGNIQLASEPYYKPVKLADGVWQVLTDGDYTYVLEGDDHPAVCQIAVIVKICFCEGKNMSFIRKRFENIDKKRFFFVGYKNGRYSFCTIIDLIAGAVPETCQVFKRNLIRYGQIRCRNSI